jgi:hypothetical protein
MTDAERLKNAFKRAKTRVDKYNKEVEEEKKRRSEIFYQKTVEDIFNFYETLNPPTKTLSPPTCSISIPFGIVPAEILSLFMIRGFNVKTEYHKSNDKYFLIFDFS